MPSSFVRSVTLIVLICVLTVLLPQARSAEPARSAEVPVETKAIGSLAACNLFSSFACVGLTADGFEAGLYSPADVQDYLADLNKIIQVSIESLNKYGPAETLLAEGVTVGDLVGAYSLLETEADKLQAYARATPGPEKVKARQAYKDARDASWRRIAAVLGVDADAKTRRPAEADGKGEQK